MDANREERTLTIHGGRDHIRMTLRYMLSSFLFQLLNDSYFFVVVAFHCEACFPQISRTGALSMFFKLFTWSSGDVFCLLSGGT